MGKRILVVDDDKMFLDEFCETLNGCGYEATSVDDPVHFCSAVRLIKPHLILLELKMPIKNGFELIASMDYLPEFTRAPVLLMSAHYREEYAYLLELCDVKGCLKKPFRPAEVLPRIEEALRESSAA